MKKKIVFLLLFMTFQIFAAEPRQSDEVIVFRTDVGDMVVALYPDEAPQHTEQILKLVRGGIYTNTLFFRTDKGFVAQIENYNARNPPLNAEELQLIKKIPGEFSKIPHRRGILSMARFDDPNSAESSFSFVLGNAPHLDGQYTVIGEVIQNIDVLDAIEKLPPKSVYIKTAEVVNRQDLSKIKLSSASTPLPEWLKSDAMQITGMSIVVLLLLMLYGKITNPQKKA